MRKEELTIWARYHEALFPGFWEWFTAADSGEMLAARQAAWHGRLRSYAIDLVKAQSLAMFNARDKPKFLGDHLDWIVNRLQPRAQLNSSFSAGFNGPRCEQCNGTGIVSVVFFSPRLTVGGNPLPGNRGPAACRCAVGQRLNERRAEHPECKQLQPYDPDEMAPDIPERPTREELAACRERLMTKNPQWMMVLNSIERRIEMRAAGTMRVHYSHQPGGLVRTIDVDEDGDKE